MSALHCNSQANDILEQAGVLVVGVQRNQEIQWSNLELCTRRIRIELGLAQAGLVNDNELMSDLLAFFVILNQHVHSRYDTSNLPPWALRLRDEILAIIDGKLEAVKEELSARLNTIEVQIIEMKNDISEIKADIKEAVDGITKRVDGITKRIENMQMHTGFVALCLFIGNLLVLSMFEASRS